MSYSKEVVTRARGILAQRRADRDSENAYRLQQAYETVPRLKEIDTQLRSTVAVAAQLAFSQGSDIETALASVKEKNLVLQAERDRLEAAHFAPGYLNNEPICTVCGGSGYIGSAMCDCLKAICLQEHRKELGAIFCGSESFETFSLEYYSEAVMPQVKTSPKAIMQRNLDYCRSYARNFRPDAGNILMYGTTGLGKTHLALSVGRAVGEQGYSVCYEPAISLFNTLEKAKFSTNEQALAAAEKIKNCDLLIIDDLGTELSGQFVVSALYGLLSQRLMEKKAMIITTNLNVEDAGKKYSPQIASRLYGEFKRLTFLGSDIRVMKNRGL